MNHRKTDVPSLLASLRAALAEMRYPVRLSALGLGALAPIAALANPTGGQVVGGSATISTPSANGTVIDQTSQRAVINWQQFSVGANQYVQFVQPNSSAVVLNRVIGSNPSSIFGNITANGQVFLINPNGILFAPGATLDVAGLVASTLDVGDSDFMAGRYNFVKGSGAPDASVVNQGSIVTRRGGYVVLAGDYVENDGHIQAQTGRVYLAAGNSATLTFDKDQLISYTVDGATLARLAGVDNTGVITADGGAVVMTADVGNTLTATAVNNSGFVAAHSIQNQSGTIVLAAAGGDIENSGTLDASAAYYAGNAPGGMVVITGDHATKLAPTSVIETEGNGDGKGGFIDLSGHDLAIHGQVTAGKGGSLLLDPTLINIVNGSANSGGTNVNNVGIGFIQSKLNAGSNVTLVATGAVVNASSATRTITANTGSHAGNARFRIATGTVTLNSQCAGANAGVCVGVSSFPSVTVGTGTINLTGLTINIKGAFIASAGQGRITLDTITANSGIFVTGGLIQVNGNLDATGAILSLHANRGTTPGAFVKTGPGVKLKAGAVTIGVSGSYGGVVSVGTVSAGSINLGLNYTTLFSPTSPEKVVVNGKITAPHIILNAAGPRDSITINGSVSAVNPTGPAAVSISADGKGGNAIVVINGDITVSGKQTTSGGTLRPFDMPTAAALRIEAIGSGSGAHTARVNGNVNINAIGGSFSKVSTCECGPPQRHETGFGGVAAAYIIATGSHGSAAVFGSLSAKGPDAHVGVLASTVTVMDNISVTGSGHHVTRTVSPETATASYTSSNSAGQATLQLGGAQTFTGSPPVSTAILGKSIKVVGSITVAGKGVAEAALLASSVSAGNISITATAAKGKLKQKGATTGVCTAADCNDLNSVTFYRGIGRTALHSGSIDGGRAAIIVGGGTSFGGGSSGAQALNVKLGALNVNGAGEAAVQLDAKAITTQGLTVVATKGTEKGTGSSQSGVTAVNRYTHTFNIDGGVAAIKIRSGGSGSRSSGVLTLNGGPVTLGGNVTVTGPTADLDVKGKSIKIGGTVAITGSGGSSMQKTVFTPAAGTGYTTSFNGSEPTTLNLQGGASGSVSVAGMTTIKGPGLVGVMAVGGTVKLHGFSGSASAVKNYTVLDTRVSPTAVNFTAGDLAVFISDVAVNGGVPAFTVASDTGDMKFSAKGNVDFASQLTVKGTALVEAGGSIFGTSNGVAAHFNSIDNTRVHANSGSNHGGPQPGSLPTLTIQADAVAMVAGKGINLSGTQLNIGNGSISSIHGDSTLIAGLGAENLAPSSANPNGAFIAGGAVTLGSLQLTGSYLLLQGAAVSILGKVTTPKSALVQVEPFDPTIPIDIEDSTLLKSVLGSVALTNATGSAQFGLTNASFLSLFPGDTVVVGGTGVSSVVTIGANGPLNLGSTNLIIYSTGSISGLGTVTSTGIVQSLLAFLGPPVPPVTAGEIDPTAGSDTNTGLGDQTDKRKIGESGGTGANTQPAGTVSQDSGNASVCH